MELSMSDFRESAGQRGSTARSTKYMESKGERVEGGCWRPVKRMALQYCGMRYQSFSIARVTESRERHEPIPVEGVTVRCATRAQFVERCAVTILGNLNEM